jgi:RNA polymerase sigma factor (sigma-70 family)
MIARRELDRLYTEHGPAVYAALARYGVDGALLDDAFHDTWVVAWKKGPPQGDFGSWIHGIAHKVAFRYRRSASRAAAIIVHDDVERAATSTDPERAAYAREVARAIDELDPKERDALVAAAEGYTAADSPRKITEDGAESRIARARKAVRRPMNDDDDDKKVVLPPFDGERLWQRIERTISLLEDFRDEPGNGLVESSPPSAPPVSLPLVPALPLLAPGLVPIAKAKLTGLLAGAFLLGTGIGAGAMHTWHGLRHEPSRARMAPLRVTEREERIAPGVVWTSFHMRDAQPGPTGLPVSPVLPPARPPGRAAPSVDAGNERSFYPRLRRVLER